MSRAIPQHLRHLDTWRGLPVPMINLRDAGGEPAEDRWVIVDHPYWPGQRAFDILDVDGAPPNFKAKSLSRQRTAVHEGRCQVCWLQLTWADRVLAIHGGSVDLTVLRDQDRCFITEPWLCPDCAEFARSTCPALIRAHHAPQQLNLVRGLTPSNTALQESSGWCEPFGREVIAAMWSKIELVPELVRV